MSAVRNKVVIPAEWPIDVNPCITRVHTANPQALYANIISSAAVLCTYQHFFVQRMCLRFLTQGGVYF